MEVKSVALFFFEGTKCDRNEQLWVINCKGVVLCDHIRESKKGEGKLVVLERRVVRMILFVAPSR